MSKRKFYRGMSDEIFKSVIFGIDESVTKDFLEDILNIGIGYIKIEMQEQPKKIKKDRLKVLDILVSIDNKIVCNIEVNGRYKNEIHIRNFSYGSGVYSRMTQEGEEYSNDRKFIQINFTKNLPKTYKREVSRMSVQDEDGVKYVRNFEIVIYNIDKIMGHWYNRDEEIEKYASIIVLYLNKEELIELISFGYIKNEEKLKLIKKIAKGVIEMNKEGWFVPPWTPEEEEKMWENTFIKQGMKKGLKQGIKRGAENNKIMTIKRMLKDGISPETIRKYVDIPLEKIEDIKIHMS